MSICRLLLSAAVIVGSCVSNLHAQLYWDINGATAGATDDAGGLAAGTWDGVTTNWTTDTTGASSTVLWTAGQTAVFSAGTNATGNYSVTLSGTQSAGGVTFQDGTVTLTGGQLNLVATGSPADYNRDGIVNAADYAAWRKLPILFDGDPAGYIAWRTDFGASGGGGGGTITTATGTTSTISSVIGGSVPLTKAGADRLLLSGANVYTGGTNVNVGTLQFANTTAMPASGGVTVASGATLSVNAGGVGEWTNAASGGGAIGGLIAGTGGQGTLNQVTWADGSNLGIDTTNAVGTLTYSNVIGSFRAAAGTTNAVGLTKRGAGTLMLTGANTYTGNTTLTANGGIVKTGATNTLNSNTVVVMPTAANGNTRLELFDGGVYYDQTIAGLSGGAGGAIATSSLVDVGFATLTLDVPTGQSHLYAGFLKTDYNLFDDTHGRVIKDGDGEITLRQNNGSAPFSGEFILKDGTVGIGNNQTFGPVTSTNRLTINGGKLTNATSPNASLNLAVRNTDIAGSFEFDANGASNSQWLGAAGNAFLNLKATNPTITINPDPTRPVLPDPNNPTNISGVVIIAGLIQNDPSTPGTPRGFTKAGDGILTISTPTNSYTGETTIQDGILRLGKTIGASLPSGDGRLGDSTALTNRVNLSGGTLQYNGAVIANFDSSRTLTVANRMRVTADSTISYSSTTQNLTNVNLTDNGHSINFVFTNDEIDRTGGTLTFQNDGVCTSNSNTCTFRPTFSGAFNYNGPVAVNDQINDAGTGRLSSRGTVLQSTSSGTQTWSGVVSGTGDFLRGGSGGTTILSANNTYSGSTIIEGGTLSITNPYLADAADVLFVTATGGGPKFDLNFVGTDTIDQLFIDGISQGPGTYGFSATNPGGLFSGTGTLTVSNFGSSPGAVPEPGTLALVLMTVLAVSAGRRRHS